MERTINREDVLEEAAPAVHEVNSWLVSRLRTGKEKKAKPKSAYLSAAQAKKRNRIVREKRQDEAAVVKKIKGIASGSRQRSIC